MKKIDHIGIAVRSIEEMEKVYMDGLGIKITKKVEVPEQRVKIAIMDIGGVKIELVEPKDESSSIANFLRKKGQGIHHICFEVDDIDAEEERLRRAGVAIIENASDVGAGDSKVLFIHPSSSGGVLFELIEHKKSGS